MYLPVQFEERRIEVLHDLIRAHPLGTLIALTADGLDANHLPFELDAAPAPYGTLRGHVARANPLWQVFSRDLDVLVVFHGPAAYVSPAWYPTKKETGRVVPTWNYAVVHAYGPLRVIEDRSWLRALVERLTTRHEAGRPEPWRVSDAPADFVERLLDAIVGLEIPIARLVGKWKVSQNRPPHDRAGVVEGLRREGGAAAAPMADLVGDTLQT
ncbi:MAG: FMN-binding negative transcriptional regulator [Candidatus Rokubacteria bacterium]|nr:FMN-binding negative transcriptional regulator [Candidatus Rokubacteria bacterium]